MIKAFQLNLRAKIILILGCYILGIMIIDFASYDDFNTTEKKIEILELAYNLNNTILEARRYEKNFLLYNEEGAFQENKRYLAKAISTEKEILSKAGKLKLAPLLKELDELIMAYGEISEQLAQKNPHTSSEHTQIIDQLREKGKQMTELTEEIVTFERQQIHASLLVLKKQLVAWSAFAVMLGILLPFLMILKIFEPLSVIKKATEDIALGRFNSIEVINTKDEMEQVMEAFNTMVRELERRQNQLVQSKKLSSIGTLTAGVAHQLNNPLNNISTSCQIAIDELASGDTELLTRMLKNIDQETLRARDVVKGLLEFSRVQEFSLRPSQLSDLAKRAVRLVQSQVPADIEILVEIPEHITLPLDTQRMQEVFLNLIINSAQSIQGKGRITLSASEDEAAGEIVIEVHDTGPGIPEEIQGQIFDPFYTTKEEGQGTGLGLSVVYGIIQKHHGVIAVQSQPEKGASFFIRLPVSQS